MMQSSFCQEIFSIISAIVLFLLFSPIVSSKDFKYLHQENETYMSGNEMKLINARLKEINKPFVKSIKSPDGDIIDCVLINLQPAFDLPDLKGTKPLDAPELPKGHDNGGMASSIKQLWSSKGASCPDGTIPIRRTSASDLLRSNSISKFGKKFNTKDIPSIEGHEHAIGYVNGGEFYGAKAFLNVWKPNVVGNDFSLTQIWVIADVPNHDVNTVEAGWQVFPKLYKDNLPRAFTYWTTSNGDVDSSKTNFKPDGYRHGCYNLLCPGFVQISRKVSLGAAIDPVSTYNGQQFDVAFMIWKDPKSENWWLRIGNEVVGYWPSTLFTYLRNHATAIEYGGEVYDENQGKHTSPQMGSGHFPDERFKKAAYVRNLEVVDQDNNLIPVSNLNILAEKPNCYDVRNGFNNVWGNYIYFGGPGNNPTC